MADDFFLSQDAAHEQDGGEPQDEGAFDLTMDEVQAAPVDATGERAAAGLAFDLTQDGVADVVMVDADGDGIADTAFDLEMDRDAGAGGFEDGHEPQPFTDDPGEVSEADLQQASEDLDAQSHIQSGMQEMYNSIYPDTIDSF